MKPNEDKCHLLVINQENVSVNLGNHNISCSSTVDLLGIKIDDKLILMNMFQNYAKTAIRNSMPLHVEQR